MKNIVLILLVILTLTYSCYSQNNPYLKKSFWFSGTIKFAEFHCSNDYYNGFNNSTIKYNNASFEISPSCNFIIASSLVLGIDASFGLINSGKNFGAAYRIGPRIGAAFNSSRNNSFLYFFTGLNYIKQKINNGFNLGGSYLFGVGAIAPISGHYAINFEAGYHFIKLENYDGKMIEFGFGISGFY